ncbi:DMT family transporter [Qipengyuania sediminis]|uniref:DMT family transporter n=1 Tax=Qipengyuania sediminis TaxID=1532023 RepID=UPI001F0E94E0|nr:DMT family transporter [Qipengyuania sediminis]
MDAPVNRPLFALALRLAAVAVLATLTMTVKYTVEAGVAFTEVLFWRQVLTIPLLYAWLAYRRQTARLRTERLPVHCRRALMGAAGMGFTFGAPVLLPLAEAVTLGFTTPIFAVIFSALILKERIGPWRWTAVAIGFSGVLVIARPDGHLPLFGALVGLGAGLMVALISIQVRDLTRTDEPLAIVFWFAALSSPLLALFLPFHARAHTAEQWLLLGAIGLLGCAGQLLLTASLRYGQVASVIVMDYSALGWALLYGWAIWGDVPAGATWAGAPLILTAGLIIIWREQVVLRRRARAGTVGATPG